MKYICNPDKNWAFYENPLVSIHYYPVGKEIIGWIPYQFIELLKRPSDIGNRNSLVVVYHICSLKLIKLTRLPEQ